MSTTTRDLKRLLEGLPKGSWVALSSDEETVVAHDFELDKVLEKAEEKGEENPIILRVPEIESTLLF